MLEIYSIPILNDNYVWVIVKDDQVLIVDPGSNILSNLGNKQLSAILLTHHHWDHTNGVLPITQETHLPVYGPALESIPGVTHPLSPGQTVQWQDITFQVLGIPGHTRGHIAYYGAGVLFCGDTLFAAGCGRLFEGTAEQMLTSLQTLAALPDETLVYCTHEYTLKNLQFAALVDPTNKHVEERLSEVAMKRERGIITLPSEMGLEKRTNPFLRCHDAKIWQRVEEYCGERLNSELEVFAWLRKWKDEF